MLNFINNNSEFNDTEYKNLYNDLIKYSTILIVVNLLMFISNPKTHKFMGKTYIQFTTFIMMGFVTYWLVISKLIIFD